MDTRMIMREAGRKLGWTAPIKDGKVDLHRIVKVVVAVLVEHGYLAYEEGVGDE